MFTYNNWDQFCSTISKKNHCCIRAMDVIDTVKQDKKFIVLKHDVEVNVKKALVFAEIEHNYKISATFYIQSYLLDSIKNIKILKKIQDLEHEIAYHYDILDRNKGNWQKAISEFEANIKKFERFGFKIKTVCPHGNPVMTREGWSSNKDFFRNQKIKDKFNKITDIAVGLPQHITKKYLYISDAGYEWQLITDIAHNDIRNTKPDIKLHNFRKISELINKRNSLIISIHPHRWHKYLFYVNMRILLFKTLKSCATLAVRNKFIKKILNRFYHLAKKI